MTMPKVLPLAVRGLSRSYGQLEALHDLAIDIDAGECVAMIGRNGSGKTTAVRLIAGLLEPTTGRVAVAGASMHDEACAVLARSAMAVVADSPPLYADLTVGEHLELVAIAHGVAGAKLDRRIEATLGRLGLAGHRDARPGGLSRGMRQKAQLACALIRPFRVLVLDEPVVGLDPTAQETLRDVLLEAKGDGAAVMLTTHQLDFARGIADRAVLLAEGVVVADGPYETIVDGAIVRERGLL